MLYKSGPSSFKFLQHYQRGFILNSYKWFKNNSKIQTTDQVVVNESSGDITFRKITKDCFGTYHCLAENQHGASVSLFVNVKEAGKIALLIKYAHVP